MAFYTNWPERLQASGGWLDPRKNQMQKTNKVQSQGADITKALSADVQINFTIDTISNASVDENSAYTSVTPNLSGDTPVGNVTYSISGGLDSAAFTINASTGVVSMVARDYETPADSNSDNVYEVEITATDEGNNSDSESWTVTVNNVAEAAPDPAPDKGVESWSWEYDFLTSQPWADPTTGATPDTFGNDYTPDGNNYIEQDGTYGMRIVSNGTMVAIYSPDEFLTGGQTYEIYVYVPDYGGPIAISQDDESFVFWHAGHHTKIIDSSAWTWVDIKRGDTCDTAMRFIKARLSDVITSDQYWTTTPGTPDASFLQDFRQLPNRIYSLDSVVNFSWSMLGPYPNIEVTDNGLECIFDTTLDTSGYSSPYDVKAELNRYPLSAPSADTTSIYCMKFKLAEMGTLTGSVVFFQRFDDTVNAPQLSIGMTYPGQFGGIDGNTIALYIKGRPSSEWVTPNTSWGDSNTWNEMIVAIENKNGGDCKVIFKVNDEVVLTEVTTGNFAPDASNCGPQFGIYNTDSNDVDMRIIITHYEDYEYNSGNKPDFSLITG